MDDSGQLMLLSGIVITISFILTALTLSQVASLERAAAGDKPTALSSEWRFIHERLGTNLKVAISPELRNDTFANVTFPAVAATFRNIQAEKGYDTVLRLAGVTHAKSEANLQSGGNYNAWTVDGTKHFQHVADDENDGTLWQAPCPDADGPASGCIVGVYVYVHITDTAGTLEETLLFAVNQG